MRRRVIAAALFFCVLVPLLSGQSGASYASPALSDLVFGSFGQQAWCSVEQDHALTTAYVAGKPFNQSIACIGVEDPSDPVRAVSPCVYGATNNHDVAVDQSGCVAFSSLDDGRPTNGFGEFAGVDCPSGTYVVGLRDWVSSPSAACAVTDSCLLQQSAGVSWPGTWYAEIGCVQVTKNTWLSGSQHVFSLKESVYVGANAGYSQAGLPGGVLSQLQVPASVFTSPGTYASRSGNEGQMIGTAAGTINYWAPTDVSISEDGVFPFTGWTLPLVSGSDQSSVDSSACAITAISGPRGTYVAGVRDYYVDYSGDATGFLIDPGDVRVDKVSALGVDAPAGVKWSENAVAVSTDGTGNLRFTVGAAPGTTDPHVWCLAYGAWSDQGPLSSFSIHGSVGDWTPPQPAGFSFSECMNGGDSLSLTDPSTWAQYLLRGGGCVAQYLFIPNDADWNTLASKVDPPHSNKFGLAQWLYSTGDILAYVPITVVDQMHTAFDSGTASSLLPVYQICEQADTSLAMCPSGKIKSFSLSDALSGAATAGGHTTEYADGTRRGIGAFWSAMSQLLNMAILFGAFFALFEVFKRLFGSSAPQNAEAGSYE